jgi:hypothetical protein
MIAGLVAGSDGAMFDVTKSRDGSSLESKVDDEGATLGTSQSNDATLDDAIETVSEGELPTDHEDGELSEELSDIFRSSVEFLLSSLFPRFQIIFSVECFRTNISGAHTSNPTILSLEPLAS